MSSIISNTMSSAVILLPSAAEPMKKGLNNTMGVDDPDYFNKLVAGRVIHRRRVVDGGAGKKPQPLLINHQPNGDMEVVLPAGTPVDHANKMKARVAQRASKSMMRHRLKIVLAEREESKTESKTKAPETHEEMMVRYKSLCDLVGPEEAAKMMDADFWTA